MGLCSPENRKLFDDMGLRSQYHRCTLAGGSGCDLYFQPIEQRCLIVADASSRLGHGKEFGAVDLSTRACIPDDHATGGCCDAIQKPRSPALASAYAKQTHGAGLLEGKTLT